ncbi:DUF3989 domain-containing protein [Phocaeicola coprocola]|nr:TraL conjugative transposon family protein [Phocaeicola coprocola]MBV3867976.1 DUF3989 domain-containing protein [Phocaeicola coprocola]MBV4009108.1 DUF3989 domain-containing protein [Phocaeicola coprocola]MBV4033606.1 DUF3989 domain-containing protein [Phocaeicola coprocola]MBV4040186.1 DUF3989 domain-containing protein [Phocaeicola coprocola]MBV4061816.1 DUF3989 domain-containing protein [Phocaeicola coprocola]
MKPLRMAHEKIRSTRERIVSGLKDYLDGLPQKTRKRIVLAMLAVFATLALYTFGKSLYDIGHDDRRKLNIGHAGQLPVKGECGGKIHHNFIKQYKDGK